MYQRYTLNPRTFELLSRLRIYTKSSYLNPKLIWQIELQKLEIEKNRNDQHDDLRKKVLYLFRDNEVKKSHLSAKSWV
jgi:hypothetical protein